MPNKATGVVVRVNIPWGPSRMFAIRCLVAGRPGRTRSGRSSRGEFIEPDLYAELDVMKAKTDAQMREICESLARLDTSPRAFMWPVLSACM